MNSSIKKETPVMRQFREAKKSHPDSIMLFRMGDFYETFDKDAIIAYLEQTGTRGVDPIDGLPLSKSCLVDFSDFNQYLMLLMMHF